MKPISYLLSFLLVTTTALSSHSAERYWIFFTDKGNNQSLSFSKQKAIVSQHLSNRALDRRENRGITVDEKELIFADLPLDENYIKTIEKLGFRIHAKSRWLNAISGYATNKILKEIKALPFVKSIEPVRTWKFSQEETSASPPQLFKKPFISDSIIVDYGESSFQIQFHNIHQLHWMGLSGKGVIVAMFDTGFRLDHPAIQHLQDKIIAEYDFIQKDSITANQSGDASNQDSHGTITLSTIGGYLPGRLVGPAFGASFLLAKTEKVDEEINLEEDNWMMAAEWAEALGADIVSSSVGYNIFDPGQNSYTYEDMDGQTTIITRAANELARRGVLVVNSAGNEGDSPWRYIIAPADGFYVIAVGALDRFNQVTVFSSRGPTYDMRIKPDICALGSGVFSALPPDQYAYVNGTSLSCPIVAGIAAQILEAFPNLNLLQLIEIIRNSGDSANNPDNNRGWGKIDALKALSIAANKPEYKSTEFTVLPPRPNPSTRHSGFIFFQVNLPKPAKIYVEIFNILGQKVSSIVYNGKDSQNLISWDLKNSQGIAVPSGIYIYQVKALNKNSTGKIIILK